MCLTDTTDLTDIIASSFASDASASHPKLFFNGYNKDVQALFFIQPNWLLVWEINNQELILVLLNTGTHSDLFGKKYKKG